MIKNQFAIEQGDNVMAYLLNIIALTIDIKNSLNIAFNTIEYFGYHLVIALIRLTEKQLIAINNKNDIRSQLSEQLWTVQWLNRWLRDRFRRWQQNILWAVSRSGAQLFMCSQRVMRMSTGFEHWLWRALWALSSTTIANVHNARKEQRVIWSRAQA